MVDTCIPMQSKVKSIYLQAMLRILIPYFGYVNRRISRTQNNSCTSQKQPKCLQFLLTNQRLSRALTSTPSPSAPAWCLKLIFVKAAKVSLMLQFWPIKDYLEHLRALCRLKHKSSNLGHLAISQRTKTVYFSTVNFCKSSWFSLHSVTDVTLTIFLSLFAVFVRCWQVYLHPCFCISGTR